MTAFRATYSDWKVVKGRKVVQVVLELPLETADEAYRVLGGMPIAANEIWCAVARLKDNTSPQRTGQADAAAPRPAHPLQSEPVGADNPQRPNRSPAQVAGYLCTLPPFHKFLREKFADTWHRNIRDSSSAEEIAAECVREICTVESRGKITKDNAEWSALRLAFMLWENHPELEEA